MAHCTLRILNPECHLCADWSAEPLQLQSSRAVSLLYADSVSLLYADSVSSGVGGLLSAPTVAYCFPLLRVVVNSSQDEVVIVKCLDLLSTHAAQLRSEDSHSEVCLHTDILPVSYTHLTLPTKRIV